MGEKLSEREERSFGLYTASQFIDELRSEQQESVQANKWQITSAPKAYDCYMLLMRCSTADRGIDRYFVTFNRTTRIKISLQLIRIDSSTSLFKKKGRTLTDLRNKSPTDDDRRRLFSQFRFGQSSSIQFVVSYLLGGFYLLFSW